MEKCVQNVPVEQISPNNVTLQSCALYIPRQETINIRGTRFLDLIPTFLNWFSLRLRGMKLGPYVDFFLRRGQKWGGGGRGKTTSPLDLENVEMAINMTGLGNMAVYA